MNVNSKKVCIILIIGVLFVNLLPRVFSQEVIENDIEYNFIDSEFLNYPDFREI